MAENYYGLTDTGRIRDNNEDTFVTLPAANGMLLAAVVDGVGGYNGGEVAAAIAKDALTAMADGLNGNIIDSLTLAFKTASQNIFEKKQQDKELESMACVATAALVDVENNTFYYAHVGDTRLYLLRDQSLVKISKDHSFVGFLEDSGRLSESEAMNHPKRNEINKALGFTNQIDTDDSFVETGTSPFLPGDLLLLCSDGLTDMVDRAAIIDIIAQPNSSLRQKATELVAAANANGGRDNVTVVLVHNDKSSKKTEAVKPAATLKKNSNNGGNVVAGTVKKQSESAAIVNDNPDSPAKKSNALTVFFAVVTFVFAAGCVWLYFQWQKALQPPVQAIVKQEDNVQRHPDEIKLQNALNNLKGDTLTLSDTTYKQPILISDTLHLQHDTLYIRAKGNVVLQRDTAYNGPAFNIAAKSKLVIVDNLKFDGFDVGILAYNSAVVLKGASFTNCRVALQRQYLLDDKKFITAAFSNTTIIADTVAKPISQKPNATR
ncbi:serine/threonine-protein phosphatase [Mucilaginibacter pallidiroseus]|uniref:Serine/threonine-protein phosphatase n=1 Tax=Mucilaginibacter pallidiroseus TaxID=2599295 RepID=A0A563UC48_9SPHI|nr:protein phosphatase 2C domain-containing protein [Mucilaginibacter pallidiroseus]TWR28951.1 serine/threonine-protein phosphatase [Mucilaginibacter pallidiroseus]